MDNPEKIIKTHLEKKNKTELSVLCNNLSIAEAGTKKETSRKLIPKLLAANNQDLLSFPSRIIKAIEDLKNIKYSCCEQGYVTRSLTCIECKQMQHQNCVDERKMAELYFCPNCILNKSSPFEPVIEILVRPTKFNEIHSKSLLNEIKEVTFYFSRSTEQEIFDSDGKLQIQSRCIKMSNKKLEYKWPQNGFLLINNRIAFRLNKSSEIVQSKNISKPVNITTLITEGENSVSLVVLNTSKDYFMSIVVIKKMNKAELMADIKEIHLVKRTSSSLSICKAVNQKGLNKHRVSLNHLSTDQLIQIPVKGKYCEHIECFDAELFLDSIINSCQIRWICPICTHFIMNLRIDEYFYQIINEVRMDSKQSFVDFLPDGVYRLYDQELPLKRKDVSIDYTLKIKSESEFE